jgi:fumarate reductase subunit C
MIGTRPDKSKLYYQKLPSTWWLKKPSYFLFMLRELSSVFIALFLVIYLIQLSQLIDGPQAYVSFAQKLSSPSWILFHLVVLAFALYHSFTWFQSTAVILPIRIGGRLLPREMIMALNIGAWVLVSLVILFLFLALKG